MNKFLIFLLGILVGIPICLFLFEGLSLKKEEASLISDPNISENLDSQEITDFSSRDLTKVSQEMINSNYKNLNLSNNRLQTLPAEIKNWTNLVSLDLSHNILDSLPAEIRHFQKLEILNIHGNNLTGVPAEIGQLKKLKILNLSENSLDTFPNEIFQLKQLEKLDLRMNKYSKEQIDTLKDNLSETEILF